MEDHHVRKALHSAQPIRHGRTATDRQKYREYQYLNELWDERANTVESVVGMNSFWRDRSVFVTGATGLLGSWLVSQLLDAGSNVVCLVRDWVPQSEPVHNRRIEQVVTVRGDITDRDLLERVLGEYEVEVVFHVAAQAIVGIANRDPASTFSTNIEGTWNLLEACRRSPKVSSIVVASSDKAYGDQEHLPYTETMPLLGRHPYDVSKACGDMITQTYAASYNLPVAVTRCGNFYGGGDLNWNRVVPGTIRSVIRGERPIIRSDGKFVRDYIYIEDAAAAYMMLAERLVSRRCSSRPSFQFLVRNPGQCARDGGTDPAEDEILFAS